jgi:hypothetical protein
MPLFKGGKTSPKHDTDCDWQVRASIENNVQNNDSSNRVVTDLPKNKATTSLLWLELFSPRLVVGNGQISKSRVVQSRVASCAKKAKTLGTA